MGIGCADNGGHSPGLEYLSDSAIPLGVGLRELAFSIDRGIQAGIDNYEPFAPCRMDGKLQRHGRAWPGPPGPQRAAGPGQRDGPVEVSSGELPHRERANEPQQPEGPIVEAKHDGSSMGAVRATF